MRSTWSLMLKSSNYGLQDLCCNNVLNEIKKVKKLSFLLSSLTTSQFISDEASPLVTSLISLTWPSATEINIEHPDMLQKELEIIQVLQRRQLDFDIKYPAVKAEVLYQIKTLHWDTFSLNTFTTLSVWTLHWCLTASPSISGGSVLKGCASGRECNPLPVLQRLFLVMTREHSRTLCESF